MPTKDKRTASGTPKKPVATSDLLCVLVLDQSSSMASVHEAVVEGFDQYLADLRKDDSGETFVTLTAFDTNFDHWHVAEPIDSIPETIGARYQPRGYTALYDAIAHSLVETDKALKAMGREDMKVLHVTITDGGENSSREYSAQQDGAARLAALVKSYERKGNWTFTYLGAGHENMAQAQAAGMSMGYSPGNSMFYANTNAGIARSTSNLSEATRARRAGVAMASPSFFADAGQDEADYSDPQPFENLTGVDPNSVTSSGMRKGPDKPLGKLSDTEKGLKGKPLIEVLGDEEE
jgi:uncharacterized protein YegL